MYNKQEITQIIESVTNFDELKFVCEIFTWLMNEINDSTLVVFIQSCALKKVCSFND